MVRLIPITRNGKTVWAEDAPKQCGNGHTELRPANGCPHCHERVRIWKCTADGCGQVLVDDEHVCRTGPLPESALRGA